VTAFNFVGRSMARDKDNERRWRRQHKRKLRVEARAKRRASLHRELGIETFVHRQAVLNDLIAGGRGTKAEHGFSYDPVNRVWSNSHLFRASVTLPRV
jgi:hypothetical protein